MGKMRVRAVTGKIKSEESNNSMIETKGKEKKVKGEGKKESGERVGMETRNNKRNKKEVKKKATEV